MLSLGCNQCSTVCLDQEPILVQQVHKDFRDITLSALHDDFFRQHMHSNYGDVGLAVKEVVENFKGESDQTRQISSIEDMRRFVMQYSDYSSKQKNVTKHVNLMSVISETIDRRGLMETSEVRINAGL